MLRLLQPDRPLQDIRAITIDLDDTLWEIGPVIRDAERALWDWLGANYPRIPEKFSADDVLQLRQQVIDEFEDRAHDFSFMRRAVLRRVAESAGYDDALVEPAFDISNGSIRATPWLPLPTATPTSRQLAFGTCFTASLRL